MNDNAASVEGIKPYGDDKRGKSSQVREMFDNIAPTYDTLNRTMTLGIDCRWRSTTVKAVAQALSAENPAILDIATGTGDLLLQLAQKIPNAKITGVDLSENMLAICKQKIDSHGLKDRTSIRVADCLSLPYADNSFDAITCAFGVRNFEHLIDGYREMHRVLKPGASAFILEISNPDNALMYQLYKFYTRKVIPCMGRLISCDAQAYKYLPESVAHVPQGDAMLELMHKAGFTSPKAKQLTFGACTLYIASK